MVWSKRSKYDPIPALCNATLEAKGDSDHSRRWSRQPLLVLWIGIAIGSLASSFTIFVYSSLASPYTLTTFPLPPPSSPVGTQNFFPEFSTVEKAFVIDDSEWRNSTSWNRDFPYGRSFIEVQDPHSYGLALDEAGTSASFLLSMFHSMHCLERISEVLSGLLAEDPSVVRDPPTHHLGHCISYLRQSVMCSSDISLEHARKLRESPEQVVRRDVDVKQKLENAIHVCRNQDEILAFASSYGWAYTETQQAHTKGA